MSHASASACAPSERPQSRAQRRCGRTRFSHAAILWGTLVATTLPTTPASAVITEDFSIDHDHPETSLPSAAAQRAQPLAFALYQDELVAEGEAAAAAGNHDRAARFYRALALAQPDRSAPFRRLCNALVAAERSDEARGACQSALHREGVEVNDFIAYVRLAVAQPGAISASELEEIRKAIAHLEVETSPETRQTGHHLRCSLGLKLPGTEDLASCVQALAALAPNDPKSASFAWALAMRKGNRADAQRLLERARALKLPEAGLERMERAMAAQPSKGRVRAVAVPIVAVLIAAVVALMLFRPRVPRTIPKPARVGAST